MAENSLSRRKAQLDKAEREHLEDVVEDLRERAEANVAYQLRQRGLEDEPEDIETLDQEEQELVEAIELESRDEHTWEEAYEQYVTGVGYTVVNRLAALRCMEVRDFLDEEVTVFMESGLTPAGDTVMMRDFLEEDEAILEAYREECDRLADEIDILFDRSSAYSLIDPDADTYEDLCESLDEVPDEVWRADDVLGWVYEYYNRPVVEALDAKNTLEPEDVGPANQFYTPHWVVRMLADNSLGKLYLEATGQEDTVPEPESLTPEERKERLVTPDDASSVPELCTYLIPDEEAGDAPEFDHPRELSVIDPACGSGHFLLYAFDILERIWWAETDLDRAEIPAKVLEHNLYGVDIDLRSCQLSAFNLYLKARTRAEDEGGAFEMPNVGIVCADASIADVEEGAEVLDEITGEGSDLREALDDVIETFQHTEALGSLLDVSGTLEEAFDASKTQAELSDYNGGTHQSLNSFLKALRRAVEEQTSDSFGEQNLRSFLHLLVVLTQDYDTALMNPPYGSRGRMPDDVSDYVENHYEYTPEYYINFFESCERLAKSSGRIGMLVPRSFMFKRRFTNFRQDFIGKRGSFDYLAEFGLGILDKATVRTIGTVVRADKESKPIGDFVRLSDVDPSQKEGTFLETIFSGGENKIQRSYEIPMTEFGKIPWAPLSYWTPSILRELHASQKKLDSEVAGLDTESVGKAAKGMDTGDNDRFLRYHWEAESIPEFIPYAKGGSDAWIMPEVTRMLNWVGEGSELSRYSGSNLKNSDYYGREGLTWTYAKETGRRFGYFPRGGAFDGKGSMLFPEDADSWILMAVLNSSLYHGLFLSLTPERDWQVGDVARIPWLESLEGATELSDLSRQQYDLFQKYARTDPTSPYYVAPLLYDDNGDLFYDHPFKDLQDSKFSGDSIDYSRSLQSLLDERLKDRSQRAERIEMLAEEIDDKIYNLVGIDERVQLEINAEISARTSTTSSITDMLDENSTETLVAQEVKALVNHIVVQIVSQRSDGIVPISETGDEPTLYDKIIDRADDLFGEHAEERLHEVDTVLGSQSSDVISYPNLRDWIKEDLFDYHVSTFDRTPILWRFTSERLVSDPEGEGFSCLVDYHQLDGGLFDRLQHGYLEPRKTLLRERRSAANRKRGDASLSASEQAEAADEYARCESGLEQIEVLEDRLADLAQPSEREWLGEQQALAESMVDRVAEFRERTADRLETLDTLAEREDVDMEGLFTPSFFRKVNENREEWIDALADLEAAFEAYSERGDVAVEAHLYDLFKYYDDLIGTTSFASNGILFTTYYYAKFDDADQTELGDGGENEKKRLLASLASDLEEYKELAWEIEDACDDLAKEISSEWEDRALSEITTEGYKPNRKHGVAINITPLSEAEIVPKTVDDKVI